jgi:hypothetical protein
MVSAGCGVSAWCCAVYRLLRRPCAPSMRRPNLSRADVAALGRSGAPRDSATASRSLRERSGCHPSIRTLVGISVPGASWVPCSPGELLNLIRDLQDPGAHRSLPGRGIGAYSRLDRLRRRLALGVPAGGGPDLSLRRRAPPPTLPPAPSSWSVLLRFSCVPLLRARARCAAVRSPRP